MRALRFIILDEPLTHLDKININYQLEAIQAIQELSCPPSILVISHYFIEELKEKLKITQEIGF